jgi:hypothetical protein
MGGAVPPLLQYVIVAWCSVRVSTGTTLYISEVAQFLAWHVHNNRKTVPQPANIEPKVICKCFRMHKTMNRYIQIAVVMLT